MFRILDGGTKLCDGITRREWLRVGGVGLGGLSLASLLQGQAQAAAPRRRADAVAGRRSTRPGTRSRWRRRRFAASSAPSARARRASSSAS
jgi:hypothetical protein